MTDPSESQRHADVKMRAQIGADLHDIESLYVDLWAEAIYRADDKEMPGGEAMNLLGPVANMEAWEHRYEAAEEKALEDDAQLPAYINDQLDAEIHPLSVLAGWVDVIRDERDQPTDLRATVAREAAYLRNNIDWMFTEDEYGDAVFIQRDALARDLRRVRTMLENVLRDGVRTDKGVPCMRCGYALTKDWGDHEDHDRWHCQSCDEWSTVEQYRFAVMNHWRSESPKLTATDMETQYRIKPGTLRVWVNRGNVRKRGKDDSGRIMYDVEDAVKQRDKGEDEVA